MRQKIHLPFYNLQRLNRQLGLRHQRRRRRLRQDIRLLLAQAKHQRQLKRNF
jgi:hypothetical protein